VEICEYWPGSWKENAMKYVVEAIFERDPCDEIIVVVGDDKELFK
jgi:hypothetical protein